MTFASKWQVLLCAALVWLAAATALNMLERPQPISTPVQQQTVR